MPSAESRKEASKYIKAYVVAYVILSIIGLLITGIIRPTPLEYIINPSGDMFLDNQTKLRLAQWVYGFAVKYHFYAFFFSAFLTSVTGILLYMAFSKLGFKKMSVFLIGIYLSATITYLVLPSLGLSLSGEISMTIKSAIDAQSNLSDALKAGITSAYTSFPIREMFYVSSFFELMKNFVLASGYFLISKLMKVKLSNIIAGLLIIEGLYSFFRLFSIGMLWGYGNLLASFSMVFVLITGLRLLLQWGSANKLAKHFSE